MFFFKHLNHKILQQITTLTTVRHCHALFYLYPLVKNSMNKMYFSAVRLKINSFQILTSKQDV